MTINFKGKTNNLSTSKSKLDPRWDKYSSAATIATSGSFSSNMPKLAQGVVYLQKNNRLTIDIRYKDDKEYDRIVNVIDKSKSKKLTTEFGNEGNVTLTYKNWNKKLSSTKELILVFASGFRKTIRLKVPGTNSKLEGSVDSVTSILSSSPYENLLSVDVSNASSAVNDILVGIYPKADPYDVFNCSGVFSYRLPFAYYINSDSINEVLVKKGITSSNKNVDKGMSTRGVGHLYPASKAQEIHFLNVHISGETTIRNNSELMSRANSSSFTYGFIYGENLYDIPDDAPEFYVCMDEGDSSYYRTTSRDCDGTSIDSKYIDGSSPARFLDGQCCTHSCSGFSVKLINTTGANADWTSSEGKIKAVVTGGQGDWIYKVENSTTGLSTTVTSAESEYEFTGLAFATSDETPYKVTVTDANACNVIAYIHLNKNVSIEQGLIQGCTDSGGINYDSDADVNTGCLYCMRFGSNGRGYYGLSFGRSSGASKEIGVQLITNETSKVTHATSSGSSSGKIYFKGSIFPAALPIINTDTDEAFQFKLYTLSSNNLNKDEILAISPTTTVSSVPDLEHEFDSLAPGWYAIGIEVINLPTLEYCISIHRFEVKYGGCMDKLASNYDKDATYDNGGCTYTCNEKVVGIIVESLDNKCLKTVRVSRKKKYENITWKIGTESKTGPGPHLAKPEDYVQVWIENTKTKCVDSAELFIKEENCTKSMILQAYSNSILNSGGCTDTTAFNYNCDAIFDDGTCIPVVQGCMDMESPSYNPSANVDDGSCIEFIQGCLNPQALNYNPLVTLHVEVLCMYSNLELQNVKSGLQCPSTPLTEVPIYSTNPNITNLNFDIVSGATIGTGSTLKAYKLPHNNLLEQGFSINTLTFPLEDSGMKPDATWNLTGNDSPFYNNFGTGPDLLLWQGSEPYEPYLLDIGGNYIASINLDGTFAANSGTLGYGAYIFELKIIRNGKPFYSREWFTIPNSGDSFLCDMILTGPGADPAITKDGSGSKAKGCTDPNASNYLGQNSFTPNMFPVLSYPANNTFYSPQGLETFNTGNPQGAGAELCKYQLDKICLPPRIDSQIEYLEKCIMNSSVNWYNKNITGGEKSCDDMALWTMIFIKYLVSRKGLDCIFNCADSGTPNYQPQTCEEKWVAGGSKVWAYSPDTYTGTNYYGGEIIKYDTVFPWMGDEIPGGSTIWTIKGAGCGPCGNPYGNGSENFILCKDDKVFSDNTNYLDKFFKFATKYCKSCQPCSFLPGNKPTILYNSDSFTYSTETDGTLTIGGISLEMNGEEYGVDDPNLGPYNPYGLDEDANYPSEEY